MNTIIFDMKTSDVVILSGLFTVAYSQCDGSVMDIKSDTGIITLPSYNKDKKISCFWKYSFDRLKPELLVVNMTEVHLFYSKSNGYISCGANLRIGNVSPEQLLCIDVKPRCYISYNNNDCLRNTPLDPRYNDCIRRLQLEETVIKYEYFGSLGLSTTEKRIESRPSTFKMETEVINCNTDTITTQPRSKMMTLKEANKVDTVLQSTTAPNTGEPVIKLIVAIACLVSLLLLCVTTFSIVTIVMKNKQARISTTTPVVTYENVNASGQPPIAVVPYNSIVAEQNELTDSDGYIVPNQNSETTHTDSNEYTIYDIQASRNEQSGIGGYMVLP